MWCYLISHYELSLLPNLFPNTLAPRYLHIFADNLFTDLRKMYLRYILNI